MRRLLLALMLLTTTAWADEVIPSFPTTSARLAAKVSDETGTGYVVFSNSPTFVDDVTVGSTGLAQNSFLTVLSAATHYSSISAYGTGQGGGLMHVGQDAAYGGGISYNGDSNPVQVTAEGSDYTTLYRSNNSVKYPVAEWSYDDSTFRLIGDLSFRDILSAPGAPTVAINAVAGNLNGTYTYRITYVTGTGETTMGTVSSAVSPVSQQVNLTAIPTAAAGAHLVSQRRIWRTKNNTTDSRYYFVATLNDNTTTTYTDNTADSSLSTLGPFTNTTAGQIRGANEVPAVSLDSGGDFFFLDDANTSPIYIQWVTGSNYLAFVGADIYFNNLQRNTVSSTYYTYPSQAQGFVWAITSDSAWMRVFERGSDYLDYVFGMSDNTDSTDRYVWAETSWYGTMSDSEALAIIPHGSATFAEKVKVNGGLYILPATLWSRWQQTTNGAANANYTQYPIMTDTNVSTSALDFTERDATGMQTKYDAAYWGGSLIKITSTDVDLSRWTYKGDNPQWFIVRISDAANHEFQWANTYVCCGSYTFNGTDIPVSTSYTYLDGGSGRIVGVKFSKATVDVADGFSWAFQIQPAETTLAINTSAPVTQIHSILDGTGTTDNLDHLRLQRRTSGTAGNGIGQSIVFYSEAADGTDALTARISGILHDATGKSGSLYFYAVSGGSAVNAARVNSLGNWSFGEIADVTDSVIRPRAGSTAYVPLRFQSGSLKTSAVAGGVEFLTDDFYGTITTGTARKKFVLDDGVALSSGRVPFATTNGRLTDDADMTFATDTLTATNIVGTTTVKAGTAAGFISSDGSAGATGSFTTADLKTVTVKDGIITSIV